MHGLQATHAAAQTRHQEDLDVVRAQLQTAEHTALQLTGQLSTTRGEVTSLSADVTAAQVTAAHAHQILFWQTLATA